MNSLEKAGLYGMIFAIALMLRDVIETRDLSFYLLSALLGVSYLATVLGNRKDLK